MQACKAGATLPAVLNAANEIAVASFLAYKLPFHKIPEIIRQTMSAHAIVENPSLDDILNADQWSRATAAQIVAQVAKAGG